MAPTSKTIVLVTGANTGIGYEIVKKLAAENPDYHILMGTRDPRKGEDAVTALGAPENVNPIQLDVTSDESIGACVKAVEQKFGRLDVLVNNAGTAGRDLEAFGGGKYEGAKSQLPTFHWNQLRGLYMHCYNVNVASAAVLTEAMTPLLSKAELPRLVFVSSGLGSIGELLKPESRLVDCPFYNASKSAMNYLAAYYAKKHSGWKSNSCCPGFVATALNGAKVTEETHPRRGAVQAARLATLGPDGQTGTYSNKEGVVPW